VFCDLEPQHLQVKLLPAPPLPPPPFPLPTRPQPPRNPQHWRDAAGAEAYAALSRAEVDLVTAELAGALEKVGRRGGWEQGCSVLLRALPALCLTQV
jgi:hypothetical protein